MNELRKNEALEVVTIMTEQVLQRRKVEEDKKGLVIIEALYGKLPPSSNTKLFLNVTRNEQEFIDVTVVVQSLVQKSQLYISGGHSKSTMIGFWDPCFNERKKLRIVYSFHGRIHEVEVDDVGVLAAPLRAHIVS